MGRAVSVKYFEDAEYMACYNALKLVQVNKRRVRVWYGSHQTGKVYPQEEEIIGYISELTSKGHCFLLVNNRRSFGGTAIFPENIVGIQYVSTHEFIYKHQKFSKPKYGVDTVFDENGKFKFFKVTETTVEGVTTSYALGLETYAKAKHLAEYMNGTRMRK